VGDLADRNVYSNRLRDPSQVSLCEKYTLVAEMDNTQPVQRKNELQRQTTISPNNITAATWLRTVVRYALLVSANNQALFASGIQTSVLAFINDPASRIANKAPSIRQMVSRTRVKCVSDFRLIF